MLKRLLIISVVLLLAVLGVARAQDATETATAPEREIYTALAYGDEVFDPEIWLASAAEETTRTTATWRADSLGGLAFLGYLHFDDGYSSSDVDTVFDKTWFDNSFSNYQGFRELTTCKAEDLTMHEFSMLVNDQKYTMRYWIQQVSSTRVLTLFIIFPTVDKATLDSYSESLFPDLVSCVS